MKNIKYTDLFIGFLAGFLMVIFHVAFYFRPGINTGVFLMLFWLTIFMISLFKILKFLEKKDRERGL